MDGAQAAERSPLALGRARVVAAYIAVFWGVLPWVLWRLGGRLDQLLDLPRLGPSAQLLGVIVALTGTAFTGWSMGSLSLRGCGLPISHLPPIRLVARGPYALLRHPIYAGYAVAFTGIGIATRSIGRGGGATILLVGGSLIYALGFEEPRLRGRHGHAYREYAATVPAIPFSSAVGRVASLVWNRIRPRAEALANRVVLFRVGPIVCVTYGAFAGLGAALGLAACHLLLERELPLATEALYLFGAAVWMLLGARFVALLYKPRLLLRNPREAFRSVGFVSWGGYLGMFTFPFLFAEVAGGEPWRLLDRTCFAGLVCSCVGRIGCLAYGCCYGRPAEGGICWQHPDAKVNREGGLRERVARIPTQLLSAVHTASLLPIVGVTLARGAPGGFATALGSLLYALGRFGIECLRDEPRFGPWRLTRGQIACAFAGSASIVGLLSFSDGGAAARGPMPPPEPSRMAAWLAVVAASLVAFVVCSLHWKRVGRW
jgi:phosphatidylglycerol:prolipoprotein diacylglycerol transferase